MRPEVARQIHTSGFRGWNVELATLFITALLMGIMALMEGFIAWSYEGLGLLAITIFGAVYLGIFLFLGRYAP